MCFSGRDLEQVSIASGPVPSQVVARQYLTVVYGTNLDLDRRSRVDDRPPRGHITFMALARKKATTIALDPDADELLTRAARERGVSRSEFVRQQLALVLEQYRRHPKPRSAGSVQSLSQRGNESELFGGRR